MAAVAGGRKDEWLALFAPDAVVEDPVGPSMLDPEGKVKLTQYQVKAQGHVASLKEALGV